MTLKDAFKALRGAGFAVTYCPGDETTDDEFALIGSPGVHVQVGCSRNGLEFMGCYFRDDDSKESGLWQYMPRGDPIHAMRDAVALAEEHGR